MPKKHKHDAKRNARLAWISQRIGKGETDSALVIGLMSAFPGTSEQTARRELNEIYQRYFEINYENTEFQKVKIEEIAWEMLKEMRSLCQMGPAQRQLEFIAKLIGAYNEKEQAKSSDINTQPTPAPEQVRERITELMRKRKIQEEADEAGIDIKDLAKKAGVDS